MSQKESNIASVRLVAGALRPFVEIDTEQGSIAMRDGFVEAGLLAIDPALTIDALKAYQNAEQLIGASARLAVGEAANEHYTANKDSKHLSGRYDIGDTDHRVTWDRTVSGRTPGRDGQPGQDYVRNGVTETRQTPRGKAPGYYQATKDLLAEAAGLLAD